MTANRNSGVTADPGKQAESRLGQDESGGSDLRPVPSDTLEAILRQLVALRASSVGDDQLVQLVRLVDSASWSAPVPMTILVDGALLRGILVPSEVSAAFLDDALRRSAHDAVEQLDQRSSEDPQGSEATANENDLKVHQARTFLKRMAQRPFGTAQTRVRQRNAGALMAISRWHQARDPGMRHGPLDIPGNYTDPMSAARDVIPYTAGQRAITLADVKMLAAGEWLAFTAPVRVAIGRIGAWTVDL